jgi:probable phosphoglycerate mutase
MDLLVSRHGEILSNIRRIYAGKSHEVLTGRGIRQALCLARELKNHGIDALFSSPVRRAVQTAEIIGSSVGMDVVTEEAFREMELGPWEGLSEDTISRNYPDEWRLWQNKPAELTLPGRETLNELLKRVQACVLKIIKTGNCQKIAVVTHVAIIRVLLLWQGKKSLNLYRTIHVPNARIFKIKIDRTISLPGQDIEHMNSK